MNLQSLGACIGEKCKYDKSIEKRIALPRAIRDKEHKLQDIRGKC
jgi:hypothetical protein